MCGIVCRHAFCGLKQIGVMKLPRNLVLNRWMKVADSGISSSSLSVSNDFLKIQQVSLKLTDIWFDFRKVIDKAGVQVDRLDFVHSTIKQLGSDLDNHGSDGAVFTKTDHMAAMVGEQPTGEVVVLAPNSCKNKGNYFKRLISEREKSITKAKKRIRKCKECGETTHDARTCSKKTKRELESNIVD